MKKLTFVMLLVFIMLSQLTSLDSSAQPRQGRLDVAVAVVTDVLDGDTFDVEYVSGGEGLPTRIETYLIDTPLNNPGGAFAPGRSECFGQETTAFATNLLLGQTVWLSHQGRTRTENFIERLLAFIYLDSERDALFQGIMLSQGFARAAIEHPEEAPFLAKVLSMDNDAQSTGRGLWGVCP